MRLLVLGGTHHVGRALVEEALAAGHEVTTLTRGESGPPAQGAEARYADRTDPAALGEALGDDSWDAVVDTWSAAPAAVRDASRLLTGRAGHYGYVSSRSVYAWPIPSGGDESAPVVDGDPDSLDTSDYAAVKRGGELAVLRDFGGPSLLARAGLVLGPYERVGRLPYWLDVLAAGGRVAVPGPPSRPLQYVDARDLARWMLRCAEQGVTGPFNAVSRPGHTTMGELIDAAAAVTGGRAELVWVSPETVEEAGVAPWTELPIWLPVEGELGALHDGDVGAAVAAGLTCRPVADTVADTWAWMRAEARPPADPARAGAALDADGRARLLAVHDARAGRYS